MKVLLWIVITIYGLIGILFLFGLVLLIIEDIQEWLLHRSIMHRKKPNNETN